MIPDCVILLLIIQTAIGLDCPNSYYKLEKENICVHMTSRLLKLSDMPSYCMTEAQGGRPLDRRFSDEGFKELQEQIKDAVQAVFPDSVFIGMKRESDAYGQPTDTFQFENGEGRVKAKNYPLWASDPANFDCGTVQYREDFKVKPESCSNSAVFVCEKDSTPCEDDQSEYAVYRDRCLFIYPRKENYMSAGSMCSQLKGHVASYKSEEDTNGIAEVIYNSMSLHGGIYAAIRRRETGEWTYDSGEEETSRWDPNYEKVFDCGVYRFLRNLTLGLFTMNCEQSLQGLCMYSGTS